MPVKPLKRADNSIEYPSFIGNIISKSDKGKIKLRTLSKLGTENIVWIDPKDIVSKTEYDSNIIKIDVKMGSEVIIEKDRRIKVGNPSVSKVKMASGAFHITPIMDDDEEEECGNCDWRYVTHCTSCSDRNSSQRCARPFFPYP